MDMNEALATRRAALRERAFEIFQAGVAAADPEAAVARALEARPWSGKVLIAVGKAAPAMARAALERVGPVEAALVVTNPENATEIAGAEVIVAAHPVPDAGGLKAGRRVLELLENLGSGEDVLALISGGGSALLPAPVEGVSLEDKASVNALLLGSGADIHQMNEVRQQLSLLKGGGFLRAAGPGRVRALVLSDVLGDDLSTIASGLTAGPIGTRESAADLCQELGIWEQLPDSVKAHLSNPDQEDASLPECENEIIGSNAVSLAAMAEAAGVEAEEVALEGNVKDAAEVIVKAGYNADTLLYGGETTVRLCDAPGLGGRNQQLALTIAGLADWPAPWVFLSGGTDGRDGPTDAAGGLVDDTSATRLKEAGIDLHEHLARNDAYTALKAVGDLLMTGGTGTNVADLQVMLRQKSPAEPEA